MGTGNQGRRLPQGLAPRRAALGLARAAAGPHRRDPHGLSGLSPLVATICTDTAASVVAATRLRGGKAGSARGAASLVAEALGTAEALGAGAGEGGGEQARHAQLLLRADSAFYTGPVISAARRRGPVLGDGADEPGGAPGAGRGLVPIVGHDQYRPGLPAGHGEKSGWLNSSLWSSLVPS
jgi:hypothetical protein